MPAPPDPTLAMVRYAAVRCLVALPVLAVAGALWSGPSGALWAVVGGLVVTGFFALGAWAVNALVAAAPAFSVVLGVGVYVTQIMLLLLVYDLARDVADIDRSAFAFGAVAETMVWQVTHAVAYRRTRTPIYTLEHSKEQP